MVINGVYKVTKSVAMPLDTKAKSTDHRSPITDHHGKVTKVWPYS